MNSLLSYLPDYYKKSAVMKALLRSVDAELARLSGSAEGTAAQMTVCSADRLLVRCENDLGIVPREGETPEERRGRVLSRIRGRGVVTADTLKTVVETFVDGIVKVTENPSANTVTITFITCKGEPTRMEEIKNAVNEIIPAHLAVVWVYTYRTWNDVLSIGTWDGVSAYTWDGLATFDVVKDLYVEDENVYYRGGEGNAVLLYENQKAYARMTEEES